MTTLAQTRALVRFHLFCEGVLVLAGAFPGASCTSWGRSVKHNASLPGSVPNSEHLVWCAADLVFDVGAEPDPVTFAAAARDQGLEAEYTAHQPDGEGAHWHLEVLRGI